MLMTIVSVARFVIIPLISTNDIPLKVDFDKITTNIVQTKTERHYEEHTYQTSCNNSEEINRQLFKFNPNGLSKEDWSRLGLSERQIHIIKNFESKGGKFRKKEDLSKIYGISQTEYQILSPYIDIPENTISNTSKAISSFESKNYIAEINTADSATLVRVKGIGPSIARKIIKYRAKLGGFYAKEQLYELWGVDSSFIKPILPNITVDVSKLHKININKAPYDSLKHPYINGKIVGNIIRIRKTTGLFATTTKLVELGIFSKEEYERVYRYLIVK